MGLADSIANELVSDLPLRQLIALSADATVGVAVREMRYKRLGCAVVVDAVGNPLGTFTERTLIDLLLQQSDRLGEILVRDHLSVNWSVVKKSDPLTKMVDAIQHGRAKFVVVVDDDGRAVALTGQRGLSEYVAEHYPNQVTVQRVGGRPGIETREGA